MPEHGGAGTVSIRPEWQWTFRVSLAMVHDIQGAPRNSVVLPDSPVPVMNEINRPEFTLQQGNPCFQHMASAESSRRNPGEQS